MNLQVVECLDRESGYRLGHHPGEIWSKPLSLREINMVLLDHYMYIYTGLITLPMYLPSDTKNCGISGLSLMFYDVCS